MKSYIVSIREIHIQALHIEAESPEEAIELVCQGEGEELRDSLEYSHTMDQEFWTVEELRPAEQK